MSKNILIVTTSHESFGDTDKKTGYYLSEVSHPYYEFIDNNYTVQIASIQGGNPPVDGLDVEDETNKRFLNDPVAQELINNTIILSEVDPTDYDAIYFAGGHGTMWDFPHNKEIERISRSIYESDGVIGAVCHGPSALVGLRLSDGSYLTDSKTVSCFTNDEEDAVDASKYMPFMLQDTLIEQGGIFTIADNFEPNVTSDQRLVTGQNPASAMGVAREMLQLLNY